MDLTDEELIDHISEMCVMSKSLEEYEGGQPAGASVSLPMAAASIQSSCRSSCLPAAQQSLHTPTPHLHTPQGRKSCAITCATRLSQFLGDDRIKDKVGWLGCCGCCSAER